MLGGTGTHLIFFGGEGGEYVLNLFYISIKKIW